MLASCSTRRKLSQSCMAATDRRTPSPRGQAHRRLGKRTVAETPKRLPQARHGVQWLRARGRNLGIRAKPQVLGTTRMQWVRAQRRNLGTRAKPQVLGATSRPLAMEQARSRHAMQQGNRVGRAMRAVRCLEAALQRAQCSRTMCLQLKAVQSTQPMSRHWRRRVDRRRNRMLMPRLTL